MVEGGEGRGGREGQGWTFVWRMEGGRGRD